MIDNGDSPRVDMEVSEGHKMVEEHQQKNLSKLREDPEKTVMRCLTAQVAAAWRAWAVAVGAATSLAYRTSGGPQWDK